jgi:hypothetical protein
VIHFGLPDECVAWVFQVLPPEEKKEMTRKITSAI